MDVWAQNILVDSMGNVSGLVDFDRALWGDPEIEFAVLNYCGISEPAFGKAMASSVINLPLLRFGNGFICCTKFKNICQFQFGADEMSRERCPLSRRA